MNQDDMPAPAVVDEEKAVVDDEKTVVDDGMTVIEYVPPSPPSPAPKPKSARPAPRAAAPDPFAVGVRVLKMAPAWLLFTTVCCSAVVLTLGWMRSGSEVSAVTLPSKHNDARAAKRAPAAPSAEGTGAKADAVPPSNASPATTSSQKTTAANDAPAQAAAQTTTPAAPRTAPAAPKADENVAVEAPAPAASVDGKFTAQVGSFNGRSEANERVSALRAAGFEAHVTAVELPGRGTWYRVQVGRFAERGEASKTVAALRAKGAAPSALVVPLQK